MELREFSLTDSLSLSVSRVCVCEGMKDFRMLEYKYYLPLTAHNTDANILNKE